MNPSAAAAATVNPIRTEFIHLTWGIFIFTCNILNKNIEIWLVKM